MPDLSGLFTPFRLRSLSLANRIVMPAMGLAVCEDGAPNAEHAAYYARRAEGGAGLVMTEGVYIDHPSSGDNPLLGRFYGERQLQAWQEVAEKVHEAGAYVMPELWHVGLIPLVADVLAGGEPQYRPAARHHEEQLVTHDVAGPARISESETTSRKAVGQRHDND